MKTVNLTNLRLALIEITNNALTGKPMLFATICLNHNLGKTTTVKLKWALTEFKFKPGCRKKPTAWMRISRDKKTWKFNFKSWNGEYKWPGLQDEIDTILAAMAECPSKIANPSYYKAKDSAKSSTVELVEVSSRDLSSFTDEELYAELQRRENERKAAEELARKKALIDKFLADTGLTVNDLKDYE
jgi:hypothetical protein